jgi:predicted ATP-grasp superfamily ATP-dependent carboligase
LKARTNNRILLLAQAIPDDRKTLAVIRSLGKAGLQLTLGCDSHRSGALHSRYVHERILLPHLARDIPCYLSALCDILESGSFDAVFPTGDSIVLVLSNHKAELPHPQRLLVPDAAAAAICKDKLLTAEFAAGLGLESPRTICPESREALVQACNALSFPCVLKPRITAGSVGMQFASNPAELLAAYDELPGLVNLGFDFRRPLIQQKISGEVHEVCALFNRGQVRAVLTQRRLLMFPAAGGAGIYNETTDEPELKELAIRLLEALQWHGPAQVEFIRDSASGYPYLLEINGRFWGTLGLAIAAGMDFPALACRMAIDGDVEPQWSYRVGQRFRWPVPFAVLHVMETGQWAATARAFLLPRRGVRSDLNLTDPKPLIAESWYTLQRFGKRRFKTIREERDWSEIVSGEFGGSDSSDQSENPETGTRHG